MQSKPARHRLVSFGDLGKGQGLQRIRIGLTGLAFVFLLVLLGAVVSRSSREGAVIPDAANAAANSQPSDPLSDLGVAPGAATENVTASSHNSSR